MILRIEERTPENHRSTVDLIAKRTTLFAKLAVSGQLGREALPQAIMKYKQFLALCITSKNTQGEAEAFRRSVPTNHWVPGGRFRKPQRFTVLSTMLYSVTLLGKMFEEVTLFSLFVSHSKRSIRWFNRFMRRFSKTCFATCSDPPKKGQSKPRPRSPKGRPIR